MKVLYAFQGTGKGHLTRAEEIVPALKQLADTSVLVSGTELNIDSSLSIDFHLKGLSFFFGNNGGINIWKSLKKAYPLTLLKDIFTFPVQNYDLVINDFEPVTAWACRLRNVKCIGLSHQKAVLDVNSPLPEKQSRFGKSVLSHYAKTKSGYGFHFESYNENIFPPLIKESIRNCSPKNQGHFTVYLPSYSDKNLIDIFSKLPDVDWHVFSKRAKEEQHFKNVIIFPTNADGFDKSMINANGVLCGAGFETPSEALHLGKKLLVIPMKGQYEQQCNAAALNRMGVSVINRLSEKNIEELRAWTIHSHPIQKVYNHTPERILRMVLERELTSLSSSHSYSIIPSSI